MIPYGRQDIDDADVAAVAAAMRDPFLTQGPRIAEFEERLCDVTGAKFAVVFNSGTAALHAAYAAARLTSTQSVLTSPITFAATANAALYLGARVRFADVDPAGAMISPEAVEGATDPDVAVLAPVHLGGHVAPIVRLSRTARARGWMIVEDAAHALGARYRDDQGREHEVGSCAHSDMCCFSFHPVKHITTGEGGAVTTNDETLSSRLRRFRTHGITRDPCELTTSDGPWYYEQHELGFNYRITDFQCVLGVSQLRRLHGFVERRRAIAAIYDAEFADVDGLTVLSEPHGSRGSYHLYVVRVAAPKRRPLYDALHRAGIGSNVHYIPVYRHPYYRANGFEGFSLPEAERYYAEALTIPLFPGLRDDEAIRIARVVRDELARS